jgi:hypothetical protein
MSQNDYLMRFTDPALAPGTHARLKNHHDSRAADPIRTKPARAVVLSLAPLQPRQFFSTPADAVANMSK